MVKKILPITVIIVMALTLIPTGFTFANDSDITLTTTMRQEEPITWYGATGTQINTFDPQRAQSASVRVMKCERSVFATPRLPCVSALLLFSAWI